MDRIFDRIEKAIAVALLALMAAVVASATLELVYVIATNIFRAPGFFIGVADLFNIFSLFLMILIGLELMSGVRSYLEDHRIHAELMLLIAVTAITRKIVTLDAKEIDSLTLFALGFTIIALAIGYFLIRRSRSTHVTGAE